MFCTIHNSKFETPTADGENCCYKCKQVLLMLLRIKSPHVLSDDNSIRRRSLFSTTLSNKGDSN